MCVYTILSDEHSLITLNYHALSFDSTANYTITHFDEFIDQLLNEERVCDIILPRLTKRDVLEELGELGPRKSLLLDAMEGKERSRSRSRSRESRSRSRSPTTRKRSRSLEDGEASEGGKRGRSLSRSDRTGTPSEAGSRYVSRSPSRSRSRSGSRYRSRSRSISPDRMDTAA